MSDYEKQGTAYDPHAVGYERQGREPSRADLRFWLARTSQQFDWPSSLAYADKLLDGEP